MEFARSSGLPATGSSVSVYTPTPPTYFFQVMSLLHARLASESVEEWPGNMHRACVGPGESQLTKVAASEFNTESAKANGRGLVMFLFV